MKTLFQIIADKAEKPLATKGELDELREFQKAWTAARDCMNQHDVEGAYRAFIQHQAKLGQAVRNATIADEDGWKTRQHFEQDFAEKGAAAREQMRQISIEARPLARSLCERFCEVANQIANDVEKPEAETFAEFELNYNPSVLVLTLRKIPSLARQRIPESTYAQSSPADMLPFLTL
jgi:S-methylmethionine-dependent homocysteine/selenocysteine methylase